jgi:hypothetical protein
MGSVLLLYNGVAIMCINKHKYIRDSCINKLRSPGNRPKTENNRIYATRYIYLH